MTTTEKVRLVDQHREEHGLKPADSRLRSSLSGLDTIFNVLPRSDNQIME